MKNFLPTHLPNDWQQLPLEPLVTRMSNGISKRQTKDGNGLPVSRIETISQGVVDLSRVGYLSDLSTEETEKYRLECGDLLFSHINSDLHLGKTAVFSMEGETLIHGMNLLLIRVDRDKMLPVFLHWLFNYYRVAGLFMSIAQHAVNQSSINQRKLNALPIVVPPLPEQRRIVAEIEKQFTRLEAGVTALRRVLANLKRYRAAVLKAACEGRLVPTEAELHQKLKTKNSKLETGAELLARILTERHKNWQGRGQYKEPAAADIANLGELPEGWTWSSLAQLATHITDGTHKTPTYVETGAPFLSAKDISGFHISFDKCRYIPQSEHEELSKRCTVRRGNVLITKSGTIGRVAVVETDAEFSLFESVANVPVISPIEPKFISFAAFVGIAGAFGAANQKGVAVRHLHLEDLRRVPIALPPLAEQTRIVAEVERRLSVVEELESAVSANLQRATRLRQSILQKAFTGELVS